MPDTTEKLSVVLETLGSDGITAYYVYLFLDYGTFWVVTGLIIWGCRTLFTHLKKQQEEDKNL